MTGTISFNEFTNQLEYQNVGTELNNLARSKVLDAFDAAAAQGKTVEVTGAFLRVNPNLVSISSDVDQGRRMTGEVVMRAIGIEKRYGGTHALKGVDFEIRSGSVTVLFGENGAGKSTLMKILSGVETPTAGVLELFGRPAQFPHLGGGVSSRGSRSSTRS